MSALSRVKKIEAAESADPNELVNINIRAPRSLDNFFQKKAKARHCSKSDVIREALLNHVSAAEKQAA